MAGGDEFQANLRLAQDQNEDKENASTAGGSYNGSSTPGGTSDATYNSQPNTSEARGIEQPKKDPQNFLQGAMEKYSRGNDLQEKGEGEADRKFEEGLDPELAKQAQQGGDFGPKDLARYRELYDKKYGGGGSGGGSEGGTTTPAVEESVKEDTSRERNWMKYGSYGNIDYKGPTFAGKAIAAAKGTNPVDFKALDQRIHDRPLYTQAKADIKHSETFGDTWSWDSAPKWNTERFQSEPMENRYADVMKDSKDKDDD